MGTSDPLKAIPTITQFADNKILPTPSSETLSSAFKPENHKDLTNMIQYIKSKGSNAFDSIYKHVKTAE